MPIIESFSPITRGVGSPEGKVSAPVGTTYTDSAATNGAIRWIKASGTGNTGWRVEYGDTGWRDITALATTAPTSGRLLLARDDTSLWLHFDQLTMPSASSGAIVTLPAGFRPQTTQGTIIQGVSSRVQVSNYGHVQIYNWSTSPMVGTLVAKLPADWPTTLPGTPA